MSPKVWLLLSGQQHAPSALYPRERLGTHFTGDWVDPRVSLDAMPTELPGPQYI